MPHRARRFPTTMLAPSSGIDRRENSPPESRWRNRSRPDRGKTGTRYSAKRGSSYPWSKNFLWYRMTLMGTGRFSGPAATDSDKTRGHRPPIIGGQPPELGTTPVRFGGWHRNHQPSQPKK